MKLLEISEGEWRSWEVPSIPVGGCCPWDAFLEWFKLVTILGLGLLPLNFFFTVTSFAIYLCNGMSRRQISGSPERAQERPK